MFLIVYMYICKYYNPIYMNDVYMAQPPKIVIVLSVLLNWNKIVNQSINRIKECIQHRPHINVAECDEVTTDDIEKAISQLKIGTNGWSQII